MELSALYEALALLAKKFGAQRLVLFGSRARGDARETSDLDLAVWGMPEKNRALFWWEAEELPTLLKFDIVHITSGTEAELLESICQEGVCLYEKSGKLPKSDCPTDRGCEPVRHRAGE